VSTLTFSMKLLHLGQLLKVRMLCAPVSVSARVIKGFLVVLTSLSLLAVITARLSNTISLLDLDYIMPFIGRSELAHCRMLVNLP